MKQFILAITIAAAGTVAIDAQNPASFPGGDEALASAMIANITYPEIAMENGIEGTVVVNMTVLPDGSRTNIRIARPLDPSLEAEALRVISLLPAWIPATDENDNPIAQEITIPVKFRL